MTDNVTLNAGTPWTITAVEKLQELWNGGVTPEMIGHTLGRPVIGYPETVKSFTRNHLLEYMDARYTPDRTVLSVAGNVEHDKVVRLAEKAFEGTTRQSLQFNQKRANGYKPADYEEARAIQQAHLVL